MTDLEKVTVINELLRVREYYEKTASVIVYRQWSQVPEITTPEPAELNDIEAFNKFLGEDKVIPLTPSEFVKNIDQKIGEILITINQ